MEIISFFLNTESRIQQVSKPDYDAIAFLPVD